MVAANRNRGITRRSLWRVTGAARAPRLALIAACALLALVGLTTIVSPHRPAAVPARTDAAMDLAALSLAEAFTRAYLTWNATEPEKHEQGVARFIGADVDPAAGLVVPPTGSQRVVWTAVVADGATGAHHRIITIAAETTNGPVHLAVPVSRDARGLLFVSAAPAIVGPPARSTKSASSPETEVEARELRTVAARVVRNYVAGERDDLAADLDPRAVVSLPAWRLSVRSTDAITWVAEPRRVAVAVTAEARHGPRLALRYELSVLRVGGRWVVRTIHTNPIAREGNR